MTNPIHQLNDSEYDSLCSHLDDTLASYQAKIVVLKIDSDAFKNRSWTLAEEWFWVDRSVSDPFAALEAFEKQWIAKYLGDSEAKKIANEFGEEGEIHSLMYVETSSCDDDNLSTSVNFLTAFSQSECDCE